KTKTKPHTRRTPKVSKVEKAKRGGSIADTLRDIILERIQSNRLVLPTIPKATSGALTALSRPETNLGQVAETPRRDRLIAPQLLRTANSAAYGASCAPKNLQQAMVRIGVDRLRTLLFELSIHRVFRSPRPSLDQAFRGVWRHSLLVATLARKINE